MTSQHDWEVIHFICFRPSLGGQWHSKAAAGDQLTASTLFYMMTQERCGRTAPLKARFLSRLIFVLFFSLSPQNLLFQAREDMFDKRTCILQPVLSINHSKMSLLGQAELGPSKNCFQQQKFTIIFNGPSDNYWPIYLHYLLKRLSFVLVRAWNEEVYAHEEIKTGKKNVS